MDVPTAVALTVVIVIQAVVLVALLRLRRRFDGVGDALTTPVTAHLDARMDRLVAQLNGLEEHIDDLGSRLDGRIDGIATAVNARIDGLAGRVERMANHLETTTRGGDQRT